MTTFKWENQSKKELQQKNRQSRKWKDSIKIFKHCIYSKKKNNLEKKNNKKEKEKSKLKRKKRIRKSDIYLYFLIAQHN